MANESVISICNRALSLAGITKRITSFDEETIEAKQCKMHFEALRDGMLQEHVWRFATKHAPLALTDETHPNWLYVYQYPSDCLRLTRVFSASGADMKGQEWLLSNYERTASRLHTFELYSMDSSRVVLCNIECAYGEYVSKAIDPLQYPPLFAEALVWRIAMELAVPLSGGNFDNREKLAQFYSWSRSKAVEADANEALDIQQNYHTAYEDARR